MTLCQVREQGRDGQLVQLGQRAALPFPAQRLGLQALATAVGTGVIGTVTREENADVHLVRRLLQPAEKSLQPVPVLWPFLAVFVAVAGFAIDDEALVLGAERRER